MPQQHPTFVGRKQHLAALIIDETLALTLQPSIAAGNNEATERIHQVPPYHEVPMAPKSHKSQVYLKR
jgi:hypothetical protein